MKKVFLINFLLLFPFSVVLAEGTYNSDVKVGKVDKKEVEEKIIDLGIKWDSMDFTYNVVNNYSWDSEDHVFVKKVNSYWSNNGNNIYFTNNSMRSVLINTTFNSYTSDISGKVSNSNFSLSEGKNSTIKFNISGHLTDKYLRKTNVGKITVYFK